MKKWLSFFLTLLLVCLVPFASFASAVTFTQGVTVTFPSDYTALYSGMPQSELNAAGMTKNEVEQLLAEDQNIAEAYNSDMSRVISVSVVANQNKSLTALGDGIVNMMLDMMRELYEDQGYQVDQIKIDHINGILYMVIWGKDLQKYPFLQFYAVEGYQSWNFKLYALDASAISARDEAMFRDFMTQVNILGISQPEQKASAGKGSVYTDPLSGMTAVVPEGWSEEPLSKERQFVHTKYGADDGSGMTIVFGSGDMWGSMSSSQRTQMIAAGYMRANIDISMFSPEDFTDVVGTESVYKGRVRYGGREYMKYHVSQDVFGIPFTETMLIYADNGYMYFFMFSGTDANLNYYPAFEQMMNTVQYK